MMRKLYIIITLLIVSIVMLFIGIHIGSKGYPDVTISNTTSVDSIRNFIHQNALETYNARLITTDKKCALWVENGYIDGCELYHQNGEIAMKIERGKSEHEDYFVTVCYTDKGDKIDIQAFIAQYPELYKRVGSLLVLDFYIR